MELAISKYKKNMSDPKQDPDPFPVLEIKLEFSSGSEKNPFGTPTLSLHHLFRTACSLLNAFPQNPLLHWVDTRINRWLEAVLKIFRPWFLT